MQGFFTAEETHKGFAISSTPRCVKCGLWKTCASPRMPPSGEGRKGILVVAEAPGRTEDERNVQLVGQSGRLFRSLLKEAGIDLDRDCWKTNAVCCRPPENRTPTPNERACCSPSLVRFVEKRKPKQIWALGRSALSSLFPQEVGNGEGEGFEKWRGFMIPDRNSGAWVCPMYHPAFLLRQKEGSVATVLTRRDIKEALRNLGNPLPDIREKVNILSTAKEVKAMLAECRKFRVLTAFDYETTGLKPFAKGHRVVCASVSFRPFQGYSFMMTPEVIPDWVEFLKDGEVPKTAANVQFEWLWSRIIFRTKVQNLRHDSMLGARIIDSKTGTSSLKFQAFVRFGVRDYESEVKPYLKGVDEGNANSLNRIDDCPTDSLLHYCCLDSIYERALMLELLKEMPR